MSTPPPLPGAYGPAIRVTLQAHGVRDFKNTLNSTKKAILGWADAIKQGIGIDLVRRATDAAFYLTRQAKEFLDSGIKFNAMVENAQIGLAAVLRSTLPEQFYTFNMALEKSRDLMEELRVKANRVGVGIADAAEVYSALSGMMTKSGIELDDQIDTLLLIMKATKAQGLHSQIQLMQEARAILMGESLRGALVASSAQMTPEGIKNAQIEGRMTEYIRDHLKGFTEALDTLSDSFNTLMTQFKSAGAELAGLFTEELFNDLKEGLWALVKILKSPVMQKLASIFGKIAWDVTPQLAPGPMGDAKMYLEWQRAIKEAVKYGSITANDAMIAMGLTQHPRDAAQDAFGQNTPINDWGMWMSPEAEAYIGEDLKAVWEDAIKSEKEAAEALKKLEGEYDKALDEAVRLEMEWKADEERQVAEYWDAIGQMILDEAERERRIRDEYNDALEEAVAWDMQEERRIKDEYDQALEEQMAREVDEYRKRVDSLNGMLGGVFRSVLSSHAPSGLAQRGLYASSGVANYYSTSLNQQRTMVDILRDIAKSERKALELL